MNKYNFLSSFIIFSILTIFLIVPINVSATITSSQATVTKVFTGTLKHFFQVEKALLLQDSTMDLGITCRQRGAGVVDENVSAVFTTLEISTWLDHSKFPHCLSETSGSTPRGKSIYADDTTADQFCILMGYEGYVEGTGTTGSYSGYTDEMTMRYNGTTWVLYPHGSGEIHYNSLTCGSTGGCVEDEDCSLDGTILCKDGNCVVPSCQY